MEDNEARRYYLLAQIRETELRITQAWSRNGEDLARLPELLARKCGLESVLRELEPDSPIAS